MDNAYLPAGYEPVGIKEYGGIIYIAAYNPITHRSQIGSFPSPERNMGVEYKDNGVYLNFHESFFGESNTDAIENYYNNSNKLTAGYLKNDIFLLPLTKDTSLHAGDKFTVYSDYIWGNRNYITNFGGEIEVNGQQTNQKYNRDPFNSYFTLSIGILNAQNEFSDITPSLERFDNGGNIIKGFESEEDKFNTGYFIAPEDDWKRVNGLSTADATLLNERDKKGTNTYAYKLTGPLYLKAELNHIKTFSYSLESSKDNSYITLFITGTFTYNCPHPTPNSCFKLFTSIDNGNYKLQDSEQLPQEISKIKDAAGNYIYTVLKKYKIQYV